MLSVISVSNIGYFMLLSCYFYASSRNNYFLEDMSLSRNCILKLISVYNTFKNILKSPVLPISQIRLIVSKNLTSYLAVFNFFRIAQTMKY